MSRQQSLFGEPEASALPEHTRAVMGLPPNVHARDPEPSRIAAEFVGVSGDRQRHIDLVVELVRRHPDQTCCEGFEAADPAERAELKEVQEYRRRCTDAQALALVERSGQRTCRIRGTLQSTWRAT